MSILLSPAFLIFVLLVVLNFVLIFSGNVGLQVIAGLFTVALILASIFALIAITYGRIIGFITLILGIVMAFLLAQQAGWVL